MEVRDAASDFLRGLAGVLVGDVLSVAAFLGRLRGFAGDEGFSTVPSVFSAVVASFDLGGLPRFFLVGLASFGGFMAGVASSVVIALGCGTLTFGSND